MTVAKILIAHLQVLDVFSRYANVHWPEVFGAFLRALNLSGLLGIQVWVGDLLLPFECALEVPLGFYTTMVVTLLLPLILSLFIFFIAWLVWRSSTLNRRGHLFTLISSPAVFNVHLWLSIFLYPSVCRTTLAAFQCTPLCHTPTLSNAMDSALSTMDSGELCGGGEVSYVLFHDPSTPCYTPAWTLWALVATIGIFTYCIGAPLAFLLLTSRLRGSPHGRARVGLLLVSYSPTCWYFESVEMFRRLLLTSVVLVVSPNSREQLWFGLVISMSFAVITVNLRPYRDLLPGMVQVAAQLQVVFNYASAGLFYSDHASSADRGASHEQYEYIMHWGVLLVVINCSAFVVLTVVLFTAMRTQQNTLGELKLVGTDGSSITLHPPATEGGFHLFLSHQWRWGQDQVGTIKSVLQALLPSCRCFLDVDSLEDIELLEAHVRESDMVLVMLTQGYISSANCRRELVEAIRQKKRLILLQETDDNHGALKLEALVKEVELLPLQADRDAGAVLVRMVEAGAMLEWHREGHLKRAVLAAITQAMLEFQAPAGKDEASVVQVVRTVDRYTSFRSPRKPRVHMLSAYRAVCDNTMIEG